MNHRIVNLSASLFLLPSVVLADPVQALLSEYQAQGAADFSEARGRGLWNSSTTQPTWEQPHSCTACHNEDISLKGKHIRTGKPIEPITPSVNPKQLSDRLQIEKWFKRNCKWTLGRVCTAQEKGDLLAFLQTR